MKTSRSLSVVLVALSFLLSTAVTAQPGTISADLKKRVDALFAEYDKSDSPGYALAIVEDGKIVYEHGYGMADLEHGAHMSPHTIFDIASMSKQFTAMCVLMLAQEGKLSLDDDIRKYLPEMRDYGTPITIRHLLHHTSGIRDYLSLMDIAGMSLANDYADQEVIDLIARQRELNFKPGDEHLYSNSGFFLLSAIVQRASGVSLREFAQERIFKPLGMKHTHFHDDPFEIVKDRAIGYSLDPEGDLKIDTSMFHVVGDGGVYTSVEDLAIWDRNFYDNALEGGRELVEQMVTPGKLNSGEALDYAFGLITQSYRGLATIWHTGGWAGYVGQFLRFPEQKASVICLANIGTADPSGMAYQIADIILAKQFEQPSASGTPGASEQPKTVELPEGELKTWEGLYRDRKEARYRRIVLRDGALRYVRSAESESELEPLARDRFRMRGLPVEVVFDSSSSTAPVQMIVTVGKEVSTFDKVPPFEPTAVQLADYAGGYRSEELETSVTLKVVNGTLVLFQHYSTQPLPAEPTTTDAFAIQGQGLSRPLQGAEWIALTFQRNDKGQATGLLVGAEGVRSITFVRE